MEKSDSELINEKAHELTDKYPTETWYGSRCGLWTHALEDGVVTKELYGKAKKYYSNLWNYTGD